MTTPYDILGRAPAMRPYPQQDIGDPQPGDDWMGERLIRIPRHIDEVKADGLFASKVNRGKALAKKARRARVIAMHGKGITRLEIAAELGCSTSTIDGDFTALGLTK